MRTFEELAQATQKNIAGQYTLTISPMEYDEIVNTLHSVTVHADVFTSKFRKALGDKHTDFQYPPIPSVKLIVDSRASQES